MNAWAVYALILVCLLLLVDRVIFARLRLRNRIAIIASGLAVLLTPTAVPDTQALAPAWFVASFEFIFGDPSAVNTALQPLLLCLLLVQLIFLISTLWQRRANLSR